jgi:imidazolonepropionase-like amidohydrolase
MLRGSRGVLVSASLALACAALPFAKDEPVAAKEPAPIEKAPPAPPLLIRNAIVMTAAGPTLENADVLASGGRILAIGPGLAAPPGAEIVDARGRTVTPGIIDPHSHLGVYSMPASISTRDGNEMTGPFKPEVRAEDAFWPQDPAIETALAGGVTAIHVLPGSGNLVGGQGVTLRLVPALGARAMKLDGAPTTMKLACGENPMRYYGMAKGTEPMTRMGEVAMLRQRFENARVHAPADGKPRDFALEALAKLLKGDILAQNHCYRADEMLVRLDLYAEFGAKPRAFHHAVEAYKVRGELARAGVGAVVWADWAGLKLELFDAIPANAALLDAAGVRVALHSDSPYEIQHLNQEAAKARAAGLRAGLPVSREAALRWITANPAWVLGVDERLGTLEPGKDADLVLWSGDPFSVYTRADQVWIEGRSVYERGAAVPPRSDFELGLDRKEAP